MGRSTGVHTRRVGHKKHGLPRNLFTTFAVVALPLVVAAIAGYFWIRPQWQSYAANAVNVDVLRRVPIAAAAIALIWVLAIVAGHRLTRLSPAASGAKKSLSRGFTTLMCLLVALPLATGGWAAWITRDTILSTAKDEVSATTPNLPTESAAPDPWGGRQRINVMLLGGDGGVGREGIRTDTVIVASINLRNGRTTTFSLPRNLMRVPFPETSPLSKVYPYGFSGTGDAGEYMLNAIYRNVPALHPGVLGKSDNEGADALKQGVSGALGIPVDYYVLVNLRGFREVVDAIGGITVNINRPIPINGDTDRRIPPTGWLKPGPNQRLDGYHALWYARGRWGLTDYDRMERQRCALNAIVAEADPGNLLFRYGKLARAAKKILRTDIPRRMLPHFAEVALKMKGHSLRSVVFQHTATFDPNNPDYDYMHRKVRRALRPPKPQPTGSASPSPSGSPSATPTPGEGVTDTRDQCGYHLITTVPANPY